MMTKLFRLLIICVVYFDYLDMIKAYIRQQIHEIPRTDQNRHKRNALRSISTEVSEFLHCWIEDDEESKIFTYESNKKLISSHLLNHKLNRTIIVH